ncbi:MAG: DUF2269 family protein [Thermoleophilia bacterium]|nr:DUF2269 family protein [Thermoleophilia bacterium]
MTAELALFVHLLGAFVLVAGVVVAGVAHAAARRQERARDVALLLGLARWGALLVAGGTLVVVAFGVWLVGLTGHGFAEPWVVASPVLLTAALALGAAGGRRPRAARELAVHLAERDAPVTADLRRLLDDRASAAANYAAAAAVVAIVALMVWRPGQ